MRFDTWVKNYSGMSLNPDGVYGVQCVDLIKHYCVNVIGIKKAYTDAWGNAVEWYTQFNKKPWLTANFIRIANTAKFVPQKGDIAIFKTSSKNGHIAVCTGVGDTKSFQAYDENYNGTHAGMTLRTFTYTTPKKLLGVLRPKDQSNIIAKALFEVGQVLTLTTNVKVREGAGVTYAQKKRSALTESGKKNAKAGIYAVLKAGTKVTVQQVVADGNNVWVRIPSGWIAAHYNGSTFVK